MTLGLDQAGIKHARFGGGVTPLAVGPFCRRGSSQPDFREDEGVLRQESASRAVDSRLRVDRALQPSGSPFPVYPEKHTPERSMGPDFPGGRTSEQILA